MARSDFGSSGFGVPPTERVAEVSFYDQRDHENRDRRHRQGARPHHATLIDLLFEDIEADQTKPENNQQEQREKAPRRRSRPAMTKPGSHALTASQHPTDPHPQIPHEPDAETDRRVRLAAEEADEESRIDERIREARQVSTQLRYCLSQHTETARKVSSYLHALLMITHGSYKPKLVIEV